MTDISRKTIKELWGKAACRCSICNKELILDDPKRTCIGEHCHIISKKPDGPRHQKYINDYDAYDNLILLCRNHHKEIDDNPINYTIEKLKQIKNDHEKRIAQQLKKEDCNIEIADKVTAGEELGALAWGCHSYRVFNNVRDHQSFKIEEEIMEVIANMLDLQDYLTKNDKNKIYFELDVLIKKLEPLNASLYVFRSNTPINGIYTNSINLIMTNSCSRGYFVIKSRGQFR